MHQLLHGKKAMIFDMDGVILDTEKLWAEGTVEFLENHGVRNFSIIDVRNRCMGLSLSDGAAEMQRMFEFPGDPEELARERRRIVTALYRRADFVQGFTVYYPLIKAAGVWQTCIATACDTDLLNEADAHLGIREMFDDKVYTIEMVGYKSKPDPAVFLFAAQQLGFDPSDCFVIEDSANGVKGAKAAGMVCVGITTTTSGFLLLEAGADIVIRSFANKDIHP